MIFYLAAQIIFWTSVAALFYTYAGYPIFVCAVSLLFPKPVKRGDFEPKVTVLITAYNEEKDIRAKIENTLELDYTKTKLEILIASDGSIDRTDEIAGEFAAQGVKLFRQEGRVGKTSTQNKAVERAMGEIILFSDATTKYQPDVLRQMLPNFADASVGCVAGRLIYVDESKSCIGQGAKSYWSYETFLKKSESLACSLIGASGCLYAVRKSAYRAMYAEACSDFLICAKIYEQGLRTVFEPNAVCTEETNCRTDKELQMRIRIISQTFTDLWRNRQMLNPLKSGFYAVELISHKVFRYAVPLFMFLIFFSSSVLSASSRVFELIFAFQIIFYMLVLLAWISERGRKTIGVMAIPLYFVLTNTASVVGFYKFLRGERYTRWEPSREPAEKDKNVKTSNQIA